MTAVRKNGLSPAERLKKDGYREGQLIVTRPGGDGFLLIWGFMRENATGSWSSVEFDGELECRETYTAAVVEKCIWGPPQTAFSQGDGWWEKWAEGRLERFPPPVELDARQEVAQALQALSARSGRTLEQLFPNQEETLRLWVEGASLQAAAPEGAGFDTGDFDLDPFRESHDAMENFHEVGL